MLYRKYYCPNCRAILNNQPGFDPRKGTWICKKCGQQLYGNDVEKTMTRFPGVVWYCDACGDVLNKQPGFCDYLGVWYCTKCGHRNPIAQSEIENIGEGSLPHGAVRPKNPAGALRSARKKLESLILRRMKRQKPQRKA